MLSKLNNTLSNRLKEIPADPGCYLMKDINENILYVGKSKCLRNRVRSYFNTSSNLSPRIKLMVKQIADIEIIVTDNESEALVLESNLIKDNQPYFNILLKDDKKYPYLCITWSEQYPRIFITRKRRNNNNNDRFYGPYVDVSLLRQSLALIKKVFPLRQRPQPLYKDRTCLNYSIGMCPGVCQKKISSEEYHQTLRQVAMIFQGRVEELVFKLNSQMINASNNLDYESAALFRDQIKGLERLGEQQKITLPDSDISRDTFAIVSDGKVASVQIFQVRSGKLIGRLGFTVDSRGYDDSQVLQTVIEEHYSKVESVEIPLEILLSTKIYNKDIVTTWLSELKGRKVSITTPTRGYKIDFVNLVLRNAELELLRSQKLKEKSEIELEDLTCLLDLPEVPRRVEAYDISHIQGSDSVASQVVFIDGIASKQHYRKYKIKSSSISPGHSDDFMAMREIMRRRFRKWSLIKSENVDLNDFKSINQDPLHTQGLNDWPSLVVIDGGKGQLSSAFEALKELDLHEDLNICSLAKKHEELFIPNVNKALETDCQQPGIMLLRRIRDEAHRFAVTFHRQKRAKRMKRSRLTDIPGLGPKRIKNLLSIFNTVEAIEFAKLDELKKVPGLGASMAVIVWNYFHSEAID